MNELEKKHKTSVNNVMEESQVSPVNDMKCHFLVLPYQGHNGGFLIKSIKKSLKTLLPDNVKTDVAFEGKQVGCCFNIKDKTEFRHKHHLVYHAKCTEESCNNDYSDKTARRISEKMLGHSGRDKNSHVLKQQIEKEHPCPKYNNFKIISSDFCNNIKIEKEHPCPKYNNFKIISSDFCNNIKIEKEHPCPKHNNFKIISSDFCNNIKKRGS